MPELLSQDLTFIQLIMQASLAVKLVMLLLVIASLMSWSIIFNRWRVIGRARAHTEEFENQFWSGGDLNVLYKRLQDTSNGREGVGSIFQAGYREFGRLRGDRTLGGDKLLENARRSMRVYQNKELDRLETNLSTLATIGSTSPYVGLFGTVWGIMNAFRELGDAGQATLATVAPGIAEALVATAMGLFAAIPAVIAYNRYADQVDRLETRFEAFVEEFSNILQRHAATAGGKGSANGGP
ncbi:MAG: protein TolQ [Pseudomonadota bacterium]